MKRSALSPATILGALLLALPAISCAPSHIMTNDEIPQAKDLGDVMWSQAKVMDPAFKKIDAAAYSDADWASFQAAGERLQITTTKIKQSFSKGPAFDAFADQLATHSRELIAASQSKDPAAAKAALTASRDTCRACHKQFR